MINFALKSDVGKVRSENQDYASFSQNDNVAIGIVCDGMGGHANGLLASRTTVTEIIKYFNSTNFLLIDSNQRADVQRWFYKALNTAEQKMQLLVKEDPKNTDMGTTLTMFIYFKDTKNIYVFNIGDSRTYLYNGFLHQVTEDQNIMNFLIKHEDWTKDQASKVAGWERLTSALGPTKSKTVDMFLIHKDSKAKQLILTTDGVHDFIPKPIFEQIIQSNESLDEKCDQLIQTALKNNSNDNVTCLIMEIS